MKQIYCIGELLIDFVAKKQGDSFLDATNFVKKPGGAPANVACTIAKLGGNSIFIGCVGEDQFGTFLLEVLKTHKVDISLAQQSQSFTTLAFVSLTESGERDFVFSRGADIDLTYNHQLKNNFKGNIIHLGAATALLGGVLEKTYGHYFFDALTQEGFISFDPNFRADLWKNNKTLFIKKCMPFIEKADLCKFSLEEAQLVSGKKDLAEACEFIHKIGAKIITVTLGAEGTYISASKLKRTVPSIKVNTVDTTGAGDAFIGCLLQQISTLPDVFEILENNALLIKMVAIANKAGAITTTNYGAIPSLPSRSEVFD